MKWRDLSTATKALVLFVAFWLIVAPFAAGYFRDPTLFLNAPWLIVFALMILLTVLAWVARKLHI